MKRSFITAIQKKLLAWYQVHQRDLPWRRTRDPYAIWISEIMLQQTQVATVIPYYDRFLKKFSTVAKLARARQQTVLKQWEGLGYYSRARNLHAAAKVIAREYDGVLPRTAAELQELPGIGPYTAGAIASIAYDLDEPVLDGNVIRVLSRLLCIEDNVNDAATKSSLWELVGKLVPVGNASFFNQALMDLGATICTPRKPQCLICPVSKNCAAYADGKAEQLPVKSRPRPVPHHDIGIGVIWKDGRVLIDQRKPDGLLGGLWEFPGGKLKEGEDLPACVRREVKEELDITITVGDKLTTVEHAYTHFKVTLHVFECRYRSGTPRPQECVQFKWVRPTELEKYPFPRANQKIIPLLTS